MTLVIGLDTGGTYTDAALLDVASGRVLATGKALTTHDDLSVGLGDAIAKILRAFDGPASEIGMVSLSTTLATNDENELTETLPYNLIFDTKLSQRHQLVLAPADGFD